MKAHPETCDPTCVDAYLAESLGAREELEFLQHLERCSVCRDRIQKSAAEPSTWSEAEEFLRDRPFDSEFHRSVTQTAMESDRFEDGGDHEAAGDHEEDLHRTVVSAEIAQVLALLSPTDNPQMMGRLGGYEVSGVVGSGGMGVVLKAFDGPLDRTVAIKVLAPRLASSGAARRRFAREAKAAATVLHPNVIVIHGVSNDGPLPFLVMPYLRGESLQRRLNRLGPLSAEEVVRIAQQVASGLAAAHRQGLVHRDIKPANILLEDGVERVTLTDFGLARAVDDASMTRSGIIAGTPQYMSPEQARGDTVDARSDIFSLGSVMYAMCTGRPPFRAETSYGILRRITDTEPRPVRDVNPNIPDWLEYFIQRLLTKSLDDRIQNADHVAVLLQKCLSHLQQPSIAELPEECRTPIRRRVWWRSPRGRVRAAALAAFSCIAIAAIYAVSQINFIEHTSQLAGESSDKLGTNIHQSATPDGWDATQTEIDTFEADLTASEVDVRKLWQIQSDTKPP
ncbi:MAG: serine/threonine protein kinase [Planctomyces sp.]|nr:serine/threonine protein kinase [Planctomyces sp.]